MLHWVPGAYRSSVKQDLINLSMLSFEVDFLTDLLTVEPHIPSPEPQRYEKKGGDWYSQDNVDGGKSKARKGNQPFILYFKE